jgi:CheY-like chemotaxis protein
LQAGAAGVALGLHAAVADVSPGWTARCSSRSRHTFDDVHRRSRRPSRRTCRSGDSANFAEQAAVERSGGRERTVSGLDSVAQIEYPDVVLRVLVIEDHPDVLEMMSLLLQNGGYNVVAAETSAQAERTLEKGGFDLVLADLMLEEHNVDTSWKTIDLFVDLARPAPVGLLTAWPVKPDDGPRHDLAFVLSKPCTRVQLFEQLATTLMLPDLDARQEDRLRAYFRCIEQRAYDELRALCTDDVIYRLPGSDPRFAHEIRGRREFVAFTAQTFEAFRNPQFELGAMRPLPKGALVEYIGRWEDAGGRTNQMPGAVMFEFRDNLFSRIQVRVDTDELK